MGIYRKLPEDLLEVDVIIAGGGTAGCIVAGRLAAADPKLSILVIEGGTDNHNQSNVVNPVLYMEHLAPSSNSAIFYKGNKAPYLANREPIVPSGGILGGGSSINFMMYTRAQRSDFDSWKTPGWSANELLPFLNKLETYHGPGSRDVHGYDGPIHVSSGTFRDSALEDDFLAAASQVGYPEIKDLQDLDANNGFSRWQRYISPDGRRQDTAHTYLHPLLQDGKHPNLHVIVESKVVRVLFDGNRAIGVEYIVNPAFAPQTSASGTVGEKMTISARKQVIVSCGACGTPPVLERSGIGSSEILERAGVPVVAEVPGVGRDYQDHHFMPYLYMTSLEHADKDTSLIRAGTNIAEAIEAKDKILGWNRIDISGKLRPTEDEVAALGPDFQKAWDRDFKNIPDRPLMLMGVIGEFVGDQIPVDQGQAIAIVPYTAYPYSRGHMHITGPEVTDQLDFDVGFLNNDLDIKKGIWGYKKQREIARRLKNYRGEIVAAHPAFPPGSKAQTAATDGPLAGEIKDLEYSAEDDKIIEQWLREHVETTWHSLGTVKMAPKESMGCVDGALNVYGTQGLKVVDLSIAPENVGANTNNTALVIGEKGAEIIARELGIALK